MVHLCRDDVLLLVAIEAGEALKAQVVGLSGTRGEDNFFALRANQASDLLTRILTCLL